MTTGQQIVDLAMTQTGKKYVFGVENDRRTVATATAWDCSELIQIICRDLDVRPVMPDGAYWQWRHCRANGTFISIDEARRTPGALLFIGPGETHGRTGRNAIWHVAISRGNDTTIEAKSTKDGTGTWPIGKRFTFAARIPGVHHTYNPGTPPPVVSPTPAPTPPVAPKEDEVSETYFQVNEPATRAGDYSDGAILADNGFAITHLSPEDWELVNYLHSLAGTKPRVTQINQRYARYLQRRRVHPTALNRLTAK